jgi:hypothetical protein
MIYRKIRNSRCTKVLKLSSGFWRCGRQQHLGSICGVVGGRNDSDVGGLILLTSFPRHVNLQRDITLR